MAHSFLAGTCVAHWWAPTRHCWVVSGPIQQTDQYLDGTEVLSVSPKPQTVGDLLNGGRPYWVVTVLDMFKPD